MVYYFQWILDQALQVIHFYLLINPQSVAMR